MKYIDADKIRNAIESEADNWQDTYTDCMRDNLLTILDSLQQEQIDMGEVSDGYHTFNELYYYRMLYNAAFFNLLPKEWVHKSKRHHTGEECFSGGWFIVMANLPTGQISNHYELKDWDLFQVPEKEFSDEWDGHTPQEAADRLYKYLQQEQPDFPTTDEQMKEFLATHPKVEVPEKYKNSDWLLNRQEQQNVDLEKEIKNYFKGFYMDLTDQGYILKNSDGSVGLMSVKDIARYFYELGKNSK